MNLLLKEISLAPSAAGEQGFPFHLPIVQKLQPLRFSSPVTFFVGENGSGKSTILETIACAANLPTVGGEPAATDPTLADVRRLVQHLKWVWSKRTHRGFFMRSEDFFNFARRVNMLRAEMESEINRVEHEYRGRSTQARNLARMAFSGQLHELRQRYGDGLDAQSHGESYFKLFQARFQPGGLYLLDEPEAPLSPTRQLALIALLHSMVARDAQFIIATHSPILLAYPGAVIYRFDDESIQQAEYDTIEHVALTRDFLNDPQAFLRPLLEE